MQVLFISVCSNKSAVIISGNQQREKAEDSKKQKKGKDFLVFFLVFFSIFLFLFFFFGFLRSPWQIHLSTCHIGSVKDKLTKYSTPLHIKKSNIWGSIRVEGLVSIVFDEHFNIDVVLQTVNYDSPRGGISVLTEKGALTLSSLVIQNAQPKDSGSYICAPSSAPAAVTNIHVLAGNSSSWSIFFR